MRLVSGVTRDGEVGVAVQVNGTLKAWGRNESAALANYSLARTASSFR